MVRYRAPPFTRLVVVFYESGEVSEDKLERYILEGERWEGLILATAQIMA